MPLLAQRGPASSHHPGKGGRRALLTTVSQLIVRHWPQAWSLALVLGFQAGYQLFDLRPGAGPRSGPEAALRLAICLVPLLAVPRLPSWVVLSLAAALSACSGAAYHARLQEAAYQRADPPWAFLEKPSWQGRVVLRTTGWAVPRAAGRCRFPALVVAVGAGEEAGGCRAPRPGQRLLLTATQDPPSPGQTIAAVVKLRPPARASMPGGFADDRYLTGKGLAWRGFARDDGGLNWLPGAVPGPARWLTRWHDGLLRRIKALFPAPEAALSAAVLLGVRSPLAVQAARPFTKLGLAHLFALSGLHVGILLGVILLLPEAMGWGPGWKLAPVLPGLLLYVLLTGAPGSVTRAAGVAGLGLAAGWLGRRGDPLRLLGLVFLLVMWWGPWQMLDTGIRLSFFAAGGILAAGRASGQFKVNGGAVARTLASGLGVSLAAQWFTLPVIAEGFGYLNPWSPLFNLLAVPLFGLVVWLTVLALACSWWGQLAGSIGALAILGWRLLLLVSTPLTRLTAGAAMGFMPPPPAWWFLWLVTSGVLLWVLARMRQGRMRGRPGLSLLVALPLLVIFLLVHTGRTLYPHRAPVAWQVDVGQGDCAIVSFPDRWRCVIDTGGVLGSRGQGGTMWDRTLGPYLARQNIRVLDLVVLTHGHLDHTGGAQALARECTVKRWLCGGHAEPPSGSAAAPRARCGVLHAWGDWALELCQAPAPDEDLPGENDRSLMLRLKRAGRTVMVWGGDQETAAEAMFLATHPRCGPTQAWKAGHHGSRTSGSRDFLAALHPRLCLVSCGRGNRYRHPSHGPYVVGQDTLAVVRTDCSGSILLQWCPRGDLHWSTMYGPSGGEAAP